MTPVYHLSYLKFLWYLFTVPGLLKRYRQSDRSCPRETYYRACSWLDFLRHYVPDREWGIQWIGDSPTLPFYIGHKGGDSPLTLFTRVLLVRHFEAGASIYQDSYNLVVFKYHDETIYKI